MSRASISRRFCSWLQDANRAFLQASDPATKTHLAINIALRYDQALSKDDAFYWVGKAFASNPQESGDEAIKVARFIVLNRIAVYESKVRGSIETLARAYPLSPLVQAMQAELQAHEAREKERRKGYFAR